MQYPSMGKNRQYRITIPQLNGGVNYAVPPHLIEDNQLSDVKNMWYKDGRLQTRPGFVEVSGCPAGSNAKYLRTIKAQDKICVFSSTNTEGFNGLLFSFFDNSGAFVGECPLDLGVFTNEAAFIVENCAPTEGVNFGDGVNFEVLAYGASSLTPVYAITSGKYDTAILHRPRIMKGGKPTAVDATVEELNAANGTLYEPFNLLTPTFECDFVTDGKGVLFSVPVNNLTDDFTVLYTDEEGEEHFHKVVADGKSTVTEGESEDDWLLVVNCAAGTFKFVSKADKTDVALPLSHIEGNVVVIANRSSCDKQKIFNMKFSTWYGGGSSGLSGGTRLFVAGDPNEPNIIRWSALNNPLYFPENNYAYVGNNASKITAFGKQNELLVIFKENEMYCSYYVQGNKPTVEQLQNQEVIDVEAAQAMFPIYPLHPEIGCDCPNTICLCNNRLVWFNSDRKVYGLFTTGQYNERNVRALSYTIEKKLKEAQGDITKATATEFEGNYLLHIGDEIFAMDYSTSGFSYYSSYSSDEKAQKAVTWLWWKLCEQVQAPNVLATVTCGEQPIFIAAADEQYFTFTLEQNRDTDLAFGKQAKINSFFVTKLFDFGYPERLKRINPFYLQVSGASGEKIKLTYFRGNGAVLDDYAPTLTADGLEQADPIRITPNANRVREFGIGLDSSGRMEVGSLTLNYSMMGTVR